MSSDKPKGLGMGLSALLGEASARSATPVGKASRGVTEIEVARLLGESEPATDTA